MSFFAGSDGSVELLHVASTARECMSRVFDKLDDPGLSRAERADMMVQLFSAHIGGEVGAIADRAGKAIATDVIQQITLDCGLRDNGLRPRGRPMIDPRSVLVFMGAAFLLGFFLAWIIQSAAVLAGILS